MWTVRPRDGDVVTVDVQATRDGEPVEDLATSDFVYEVGTGMLAEGADEQLRGAKPGDILLIDASDAPGGSAQLKILGEAGAGKGAARGGRRLGVGCFRVRHDRRAAS